MVKKKTSKNLTSNNNLLFGLTATALLIAIVSLMAVVIAWVEISYDKSSLQQNADQIYNLTKQNAAQDYCIEYSVKPCTHESINKHAEANNYQ